MQIVFHLARADNGVIGRDGALPWRLPADLRRFKAMTMGRPMLMGRKTFESLGKPLPGRRHLVLTRDPTWQAAGAEPFVDPAAAIAAATGSDQLAVIGGAHIFRLMLPRADRIALTEVHLAAQGDVVLPPFGAEWRETAREFFAAAGEAPAHSFVTLVRTA